MCRFDKCSTAVPVYGRTPTVVLLQLHTGCKIQICLPASEFNKTLARSQNLQQRAEASAIREFKPNRSTHSIPCKCACAAWVPVRATQRPAPQGWPRGDGDGPLADGRAPGECRAHRAPPERRQRHAARVEPVGRGGPNGGGVALRPPFTPRRSTQSSPRDRKGWGGVGCEERRLGAAPRRRAVARAHLTAGARSRL